MNMPLSAAFPAGATTLPLPTAQGAATTTGTCICASGVGGVGGAGVLLPWSWGALGGGQYGTGGEGWYSRRHLAIGSPAGELLRPTLALAWPTLLLRMLTTLPNRDTASSVSAATAASRNGSPADSERRATSLLQLTTAARLASSTPSMDKEPKNLDGAMESRSSSLEL